jgi:hypothetical protein
MRFVLALLAVLSLVVSPVTAAAAQAACSRHADQAVTDMPMGDMPVMHQSNGQKGDPCCDHSKDQGKSKQQSSDCIQACAAMCGVVAALPSTPAISPVRRIELAPMPTALASLHSREPSRLERPPRSIA